MPDLLTQGAAGTSRQLSALSLQPNWAAYPSGTTKHQPSLQRGSKHKTISGTVLPACAGGLGRADPHSPERGPCALALPFLMAPSQSKVTCGVISAGHILSPALRDNIWLSKAWLEWHQSTQMHYQPFLQGGREAARDSDGPSHGGPSPTLPSS